MIEGTTPAGWLRDAYGRHEFRYWDGERWTGQVADGSEVTTDAVGPKEVVKVATPLTPPAGGDSSVIGATPGMSGGKKTGLIAGGVVLGLIAVVALLGGSAKEPTTIAAGGSTSTTVAASSPASTIALPTTAAPTPAPAIAVAPTTVPPVTAPPKTAPPKTAPPTTADPYANETVSQRNARKKAESYLDVSAFSRKGLIEQLEYSKFSTADATYGTDILRTDWNEQAAKKAKSYLEISAFSREGLIEQLEYTGFTRPQAEFGARAVGL